MRCLRACTLHLLLCLVASTTAGIAASPWPQGVGRATNDRDADLIAALVRAGRFDDALAICESQRRNAAAETDAAAKWAIHQSQILASRQLGLDRFEDVDVQAAGQPTTSLLAAYPNHRRRLFLEAQSISVRRDAALHSVLRAAVSPTSDAARDFATKRLLRGTAAIESLSDRIGDFRSQLEGQGSSRDFKLLSDLARLQQELQVDAVSLALMQTELFPAGSNDCIAAATKAEQTADEAIAKLPADTSARREVERLKVEAILRADQFDRANVELEKLTRAIGSPTPPRIQAMHVRLELARGRMAQAGARLVAFYGDYPENAPPSLEMDLVRLEFLLLGDQGRGVGEWLDTIEQRGGGYARRRAEAISLARLRSGDSNTGAPAVNPSLVAAQGQDWLRRGDPGRAGDLLAAAAAAESDPNRAIARAGEAAAALVSADRPGDAAQVLADISLAKPEGAGAAAAHLQASFMISSSDDAKLSAKLESMLRANLKQWPSVETAAACRNWLQKLLIGQHRDMEAAEVATAIPVDKITSRDAGSMIDLWRAALRSRDDESLADASQRYQASFRPLLKSTVVRSPYRLGAALLLDRDLLSSLPEGRGDDSMEKFAEALLGFRQRGVVSELLRTPPAQYIDDARWRLMRDGRTYPQLRQPIAQLLAQWNGDSGESLEQAERLLWVGKTTEAVEMVRKLVREAPSSAESTRRAAKLLGSSSDGPVRDEAIKLWDELAAGTQQGSRTWHEAKLAGITLLGTTGKKTEAQRRAKYILLTTPAIDDEFKLQYQAASQ